MRSAIVVALTLIAGGVAWNAGELHRENCIRSAHYDCSVLPWAHGKPKPPVVLYRNSDGLGGGGLQP